MREASNWRAKYTEAVDRLAAAEARWLEIQNVQRLLIGRLCLAAQGRSSQLDQELRKVLDVARGEPEARQIESLLGPLSEAISALDGATREASTTPEASAVPVAENGFELAFALDRLAALPEMQPAVAELRSKCGDSPGTADLVKLLDRVARLASEQKAQVLREKHSLGRLVAEMTSRLDEITAYLTGEAAERSAVESDTQKFSVLMTDQFEQLRTNVAQAIDLGQARDLINRRLEQLNAYVQEFRAREEERMRAYAKRLERMRTRITELERQTRSLRENLQEEQRLSMIDALTGIPNRAAYDERIKEEFQRWKRFGTPVSILAWDIDRFKAINDAYGHKAGDKVLRVVGQHLASKVRSTDFVARYGGEEFVMLLVGATTGEALATAEKIRHEIEQLGFHFHDIPVRVTASCGITCFSGNDTPDDAFDRADHALYHAKKAGRNCCVIAQEPSRK